MCYLLFLVLQALLKFKTELNFTSMYTEYAVFLPFIHLVNT